MQVKTVDATDQDKQSAKMLFRTLFGLKDVFWPGKTRARVLDAFARNGQLTIDSYVGIGLMSLEVEAWELGAEHTDELLRKAHTVRIGDSYEQLPKAVQRQDVFDLIVIDTPQGMHQGAGAVRCEHFDFLSRSLKLVADEAVFVLYVNKRPYNKAETGEHGYDQYQEYDFEQWMDRRFDYYGSFEITEDRAIKKYREWLGVRGFDVTEVLSVPCLSDVPGKTPYAFRLALKVVRQPLTDVRPV